MPGFQSVKKVVFDRLAEVKEAPKTSNSTPKCMWILERGELRSKSKYLSKQGFSVYKKLPQSAALTAPS